MHILLELEHSLQGSRVFCAYKSNGYISHLLLETTEIFILSKYKYGSHQIGVFTSIIRHKGITAALTILESREVLFDGYPVYSDVQVVSTETVIQGHLHQTSPKPLNLQTAGDGRAGARVVTADACW